MNSQLRVLHTSDWHIGRTLYGRKRYEEFEAFFNWLAETIIRERVDVLLVAGDIFDTTSPSNRAQELYYLFLCRIAASPCRHVVVTAGNHDSPSFLNAPKELLRALDVHVTGSIPVNAEEEVIILKNSDGYPELIVCAVPYLRDRDIRMAEAGESIQDKEQKLNEGIRSHYADIAAIAENKRNKLGVDIPVIAMGHLFAAGGQTVDDDGVRDLYIGSLAHVSAGIFPDSIDYVALGHLHVPQKVNASDRIRYSGSPLAMGFGEARGNKSVCLIDFESGNAAVTVVAVPVFQKLERVKGCWKEIADRIKELSAAASGAWLEVVYDGEEIIGDLRERLDEAVNGTALEILRVKNNLKTNIILNQICENENLDDLNVNDVFNRCLLNHKIPDEQRQELLRTYQETLTSLYESDKKAE
ncbi:MAG: exonuclease SbcCD subunit D C-terminal domain-containing protein [Desulfuromonadaceae bacterium]|nr:exonuclease SbcCD subunit D C-terminal domain-containing protein [Desulfuromonadaceae bacterium]